MGHQWSDVEASGKGAEAMSNAPVTEEHRKLAAHAIEMASWQDWESLHEQVGAVAQLLADALAKEGERVRRETLEEAAKAVESCEADVVTRYTPFPHNIELTDRPLLKLAEHIRALASQQGAK